MEGHGKSWKVFSITGLTSYIGEKSYVWGGGWCGGLKDYRVSPSPSPFTLDIGFGT